MVIDLYKSRYFEPTSEAAGGNAVVEREGDDIAREAYAELNGEVAPPKKKEPADNDAVPDEQPADKEAVPQEKEGEETKPEEKEEVEGEQEAAQTPEQKEEAKRLADEQAEKDNLAKQEPLTEDKIQAFAEKRGIPFVQAKEEMEASQALLAKYGNDAFEVARALRSQQAEYNKLKEKGQDAVVPATRLLSDAELKADIDAYADKNADAIIAKYKLDHPKRTELMSDEAVLEWAKDDATKNYRANAGTIIEKTKKEASDKRGKLLETIPKKDAKFLHDVKLVLDATPDNVIMNPKYAVEGMLFYTKGQRYDADVEAAYQRGLKMGKEDPKILGQIGGDKGKGGSGGQAPSQQGKGTVVLSEDQKQRAYDQFPDSTPAKAVENWIDVYKEDLKKNKNFLP